MGNHDHSAILWLIPNTLGGQDVHWFSTDDLAAIRSCDLFVLESEKQGRRLLTKILPGVDLNQVELLFLDNKTSAEELFAMTRHLTNGRTMGLISDAGLPAIADPGADLVSIAHRHGVRVRPLIGPSSIFLALMASGLSGQHFEFHGYLSNKQGELARQMKQIQANVRRNATTQIWIETPYRNEALFFRICEMLDPNLRLCLAVDLTLPTEWIKTREITKWRKVEPPKLAKRPTVFLIGI